jgi:exopolysaccharide biosynthesis WecB/TagA/CpsF family protein
VSDGAVVRGTARMRLAPEALDLRLVHCLGLPLLAGRFESAASLLEMAARSWSGEPIIAVHINLANLHTLHQRPELARDLEQHALFFLDGIGLKVGVAMTGFGWVDDVNGTDLFPLVMERLARRRGKVYLLGSSPGVIGDAAHLAALHHPGLQVVGWEHGHFTGEEESAAVHRINEAHPDVLLVGRGFGLQEEFVLRHRHSLHVPLIWTVGALFDFVSGHVSRAPSWMRRLRLEWLFRFAREPRRMWRRIVVSPPWFFARVMTTRLRNRENRL